MNDIRIYYMLFFILMVLIGIGFSLPVHSVRQEPKTAESH